ncbi:MAG: hypothetical protein MK135_03925, partial [Polyangiaceae bacterium]|nr:hypothetical protein [Polyangiaceae bacterium]
MTKLLMLSALGAASTLLNGCSDATTSLDAKGQMISACTAQEWSASTAYTGGIRVSYNGAEYTAHYWNQAKNPEQNSGAQSSGKSWSVAEPCGGSGTGGGSGSGGSGSGGSTGGGGSTSCSEADWSSSVAYTAGQRVVYQGSIYQAHYWTQGQVPAQNVGGQLTGKAWLLVGSCHQVPGVDPASLASVLSFEDPTAHWTSSAGELTPSSVRAEGLLGAAIWGAGSTEIVSAPLPSLGDVANTLALSLQIPEEAAWGTVSLRVNLPSQGIFSEQLASLPLADLTPGRFERLEFPLTNALQTALSQDFDDPEFTIVLNGPTFNEPYIFDDLNTANVQKVSLTDKPISLTAQLDHSTSVSTPGEDSSSFPVQFEVPKLLPVTHGNAGQGQAQLQFRLDNGPITTCLYEGTASVVHPTDYIDVLRGLNYVFVSCSDGTQAGDRVYQDWSRLEILGSDTQDDSERTQITLGLGDGCTGMIPASLLPHEVAELRDNFVWSDQTPLPREDLQGRPTMWSGKIYIEREEQLEWLDQWRIFWSARPLLGADAEAYTGQCGAVAETTDFRGSFVYAIFPADFYNLMGEAGEYAAEEGLEAPIRMIIPDTDNTQAYNNADGSLTYEALAEARFHDWLDTGSTAQPGFGKFFTNLVSTIVSIPTKVVSLVATVVDTALELVQQGVGLVASAFNGRIDLDLVLTIPNRGNGFTSANMQRAWGPNAIGGGRPNIFPAFANVEVRQKALGFIPSISKKRIGTDGRLTVRPVRNMQGRNNEFCIELDTRYAKFTQYVLPATVCDFPTIELDFDQSATVPLDVDHGWVHAMTQFWDSYEYSKDVIDYEPRKLKTLVGSFAQGGAAVAGDAFVTCLNFPSLNASIVQVAGSILSTFIPKAGLLLTPYKQTHMIMAGDTFDSRIVATHEYGHFIMCSMLYDEDGPVALNGLLSYIVSYDETSEEVQMLETIADLFTMQVTGGANYTERLPGMRASGSDGVCGDAAGFGVGGGVACADANFDGSGTYSADAFDDSLARWITLFHDAFDRRDANNRLQNAYSNADYWTGVGPSNAATFTFSPNAYIAFNDEDVQMSAPSWLNWYANWMDRGRNVTIDNVVGGLHDTMVDQGYSWCDRCELF